MMSSLAASVGAVMIYSSRSDVSCEEIPKIEGVVCFLSKGCEFCVGLCEWFNAKNGSFEPIRLTFPFGNMC
jgi:hypothetical protein